MVDVTDAPPEKLYRPDVSLTAWRKLSEEEYGKKLRQRAGTARHGGDGAGRSGRSTVKIPLGRGRARSGSPPGSGALARRSNTQVHRVRSPPWPVT